MALFLVEKERKTYGVYKVLVTEGPSIHFLIWDGGKWKIVEAEGYEPLEWDNVFGDIGEKNGASI